MRQSVRYVAKLETVCPFWNSGWTNSLPEEHNTVNSSPWGLRCSSSKNAHYIQVQVYPGEFIVWTWITEQDWWLTMMMMMMILEAEYLIVWRLCVLIRKSTSNFITTLAEFWTLGSQILKWQSLIFYCLFSLLSLWRFSRLSQFSNPSAILGIPSILRECRWSDD